MKRRILALLLLLCFLAGTAAACTSGKKSNTHGGIPIFVPSARPEGDSPDEDAPPEEDVPDDVPTAAPTPKPTPTPAPSEGPSEEPSEEPSEQPPQALLPQMAGAYTFSSGAGGWATFLTLHGDGSFTGDYHDSDMGDIGEDYPNGTVYTCTFTGRFNAPAQIDEYTWSTSLASLTPQDPPGQTYIEDGIRYITDTPYGLDDARTILLYTPGAPADDLPASILSWAASFNGVFDADRRLATYVIFNVDGSAPFFR